MAETKQSVLNNSVSSGLNIASYIADLEQQMIINRTKVFKNAINQNIYSFQNAVVSQLNNFRDANIETSKKILIELAQPLAIELNKSIDTGKNITNKIVKSYKQQGKKIEDPEENNLSSLFSKSNISVLSLLAGIISTMNINAERDLMQITYQVQPSDNLALEIDRIQSNYLAKGLSGEKGLDAVYEAESIVRNESQTLIRESAGKRAEEYKLQPLVQVSAHPTTCPICSKWQNRILVDDVYQNGKADGKHELLSTAISEGLGHYNCRHNYYPYVEGLDRPNLYEREKMKAKETATAYAYEQRQREIERNIREWKRKESASLDSQNQTRASQKVKEWQALQRDLLSKADNDGVNLYRQYSREQIGGKTQPNLPSWR